MSYRKEIEYKESKYCTGEQLKSELKALHRRRMENIKRQLESPIMRIMCGSTGEDLEID